MFAAWSAHVSAAHAERQASYNASLESSKLKSNIAQVALRGLVERQGGALRRACLVQWRRVVDVELHSRREAVLHEDYARLLARQKRLGKERLMLLAFAESASILRTALIAWQEAWRAMRLERGADAAADADARHRRHIQAVRARALLTFGSKQSRSFCAVVLHEWRRTVAAEIARAMHAAEATRDAARVDRIRLRALAQLGARSARCFLQEWRVVTRMGRQTRKFIEASPVRKLSRKRTVSTVAWLSWIIATMNSKLAKVTNEWQQSVGHEKSWRSREVEVKAQFAEISEAYRRTVEARRMVRRSRSGSPENSAASKIPTIEQALLRPRTREAVTVELSEAKAAREDLQRTAPPREDLSESAWSWWQSRLALAVDRERRALEARNSLSPHAARHGSASGSRRSLSPTSPPLSPIERSEMSAARSEKHAVVHVYTSPGSPPRVEYAR